jgi:bifunctional NMN adenylyltransferase/nudix hydrolase
LFETLITLVGGVPMAKEFDYLIFIGRCQIVHNPHIKTVLRGLELADRVLVIVGSARQPRTPKNPFTVSERVNMFKSALTPEQLSRITFAYTFDYLYNDQKWVEEIQTIVKLNVLDPKAKIGIIGHFKDASSWYLNLFPQWKLIDVGNFEGINATDFRCGYFEGVSMAQFAPKKLHPNIAKFLEDFRKTSEFDVVRKEYEYYKGYKTSWSDTPYPVIFVTTDAVVVQSGHILLIRRKTPPGYGLWALPGGYLKYDLKVEDSMITELREETRLKVPEPVLRGNIKEYRVFDHPDRSLRGRTITHAYLIELQGGHPLPEVKGSDDADRAKWVKLSDINDMREQLFEDHPDIINYYVSRL